MKPEFFKDNVELQKEMVNRVGIFETDSAQKSYLLAKKIEDGMNFKGLTRQSFARLLNVQPSIITRWLSGKHNFTVETLFDIEDKLDIKLIAIDPPTQRIMNLHLVVESSSRAHFSNLNDFTNFLPVQHIRYFSPVNQAFNDHSSSEEFLDFMNKSTFNKDECSK